MAQTASQAGRIVIGLLKLFVGTLASRVLGFVRILLAARYFGCGRLMDAFYVAFMIPNLFRRVLGEQAVESSFLPVFKSLTARDKVREAWRAASVFLNWLLVLLVLAAGLCYLFAPQLVGRVLAPGFSAPAAAQTVGLGRLMCPFMVLIGLAAFCGSLLLAHGQTLAYSAAPTLFNVGWIGVLVLTHRRLGIQSMALGVLVGGVLYLLGTVAALFWGRRRGRVQGRCDARAGFRDPHASHAMALAGPVCLAAMVDRCASVVDRAVASFLPEGSVAALGYALPLVLLPFALFGLSIGRAALVPLSEQAGTGDTEGFRDSARVALRLGLVLLIPLSVGTALLASPLAVILQSRGGALDPHQTRLIAVALRYYALGLAGMGFVSILSRAMYALKDTQTPLRCARVALYANVLLSAGLALTLLRHGGVALATSIAMTGQAVLLFLALRRKLSEMGAPGGLRTLWATAWKTGLATAMMAAAVWGVARMSGSWIGAATLAARFARVLVPGAGGAVVFTAVMVCLDRAAVREFVRRARGQSPR